jgi:RimJ/RimL family protein N-acetyltransferase
MIPTLQTERLVMRGLCAEDFEDYARIHADPDVTRYLTGEPWSREDAWRSLAMFIGHWTLRGYGTWACVEKATGRFVGRVGLHNPEGWPGLEVGWTIDPLVQGRGYAVEAGRASLEYAWQTLRADTVISVIHPDNAASIRVAQKLGGVFDRRATVRGFEVTIYRYTRPSCSHPE